MKVGEQALYLAQLKGLSRQEAMRRLRYWFKKLDITDWWGKKVEELSKGMAQKVQFITTILHEPRLIIFDEPFTGFDPVNTNIVKNEILFLRERGATIIFSTHNMSSVEELCDNITLINKAKTILEGNIDKIREEWAANEYDITFSGDYTLKFNNHYSLIKEEKDNGKTIVRIKTQDSITTNDILKDMIKALEIDNRALSISSLFSKLSPKCNFL